MRSRDTGRRGRHAGRRVLRRVRTRNRRRGAAADARDALESGPSACASDSTPASHSRPTRATSGSTSTARHGSPAPRTAGRSSSPRRPGGSSPPTLAVRDLGEHRLKDLTGAEHLYQLGDRRLPAAADTRRDQPAGGLDPARRAAAGARRSSLRCSRTALVSLPSRGQAEPGRRASRSRSPPSSWGRSATASSGCRSRGSPIPSCSPRSSRRPSARPTTLAASSAARSCSSSSTTSSICSTPLPLSRGPRVVERLSVLVTSRTPLRVSGEREYRLEPLPADDASTLFVERARAWGGRSRSTTTVARSASGSTGFPWRSSSRPRGRSSSRPNACSSASTRRCPC